MDILNNLLTALPLVFSLPVFSAMVFGTAIGIAIGALPGLSATMGIAVLIPLTFTMEPLVALGMISGIYNGAMYGGSIPAILLRIPGTPAGIATVFDGYAMSQKGQTQYALNLSLLSSSIGSIASALALIFLAPPLASIALKFSPANYFWLAVFGLTTIAMLLSRNPAKGLISACLGLLVGMIGIDNITGEERFIFNQVELLSGINIIVFLTGLYAIPPAIDLAIKELKIDLSSVNYGDKSNKIQISRFIPVWIKSSIIGIITGIIPALGGNMAAIFAWNEQKRSAKNSHEYGTGVPEGLAAPECANNADTAATLIPALTLGIPGSAVSAVILGALLVHGLRPGPQLFTNEAEIVFGFMLCMLISGFLMYFIGRVGAKLFINVLKVPALILSPFIICMSIIGVYALHNSLFEVWLMLLFGVYGYIMEKINMPTAPAVLAVILGPMAEDSLRRALLISGGEVSYLFQGLISISIILFIILTLISPLIRSLLKEWKKAHGK